MTNEDDVADPGPVGLAAIAASAFILSVFNAGLVDRAAFPVVFGVSLAYGGAVLVLAATWEFRVGNTFACLAFSTYGAFFLSFWATEHFYLKEINAAARADGVGLLVLPFAIFTTYMFIASLRTTAALAVVFALAAPTLWLLSLGYFNGADQTMIKAAGWFGLAASAAAWYASCAGVVNATFGRVVLPVKSLKKPA